MRFVLAVLLCCCVVAPAAAQESSAPAAAYIPSSTPSTLSKSKRSEDTEIKAEQSQRMLGMVPMFSVTSREDARPLTDREKFHLWLKAAVDPYTGAAIGLQAGLSQWQNEFPAYGQGAAGYGKRFGASLADSTASGLFSDVVYPILLKEDPRFFRMGQGGFRKRFVNAISQEFWCRTDRPGRWLNLSSFLGAFSTGAISNIYYPPADRGFQLTMSRSAISLAYGSAGGLLSEFGPDLQARLLHHRSKPPQ
jgi:hypothetical protein